MVLWLMFHLVALAVAFAIFVKWQLELGLDSLMSGAAGERLTTLGEVVAAEMRTSERESWLEVASKHAGKYGVDCWILLEDSTWASEREPDLPDEIVERLSGFRKSIGRPGPGLPLEWRESDRRRRFEARDERGNPGLGDGFLSDGMGRERGFNFPGPSGRPGARPADVVEGDAPERGVHPVFLVHAGQSRGYWAAIDLPLFIPNEGPPFHGLLLLRSEDPSAHGLFFDFKPWVFGGLAVLGLSLVIWAPFIVGITRYSRRLSRATERIADGDFKIRVAGRRNDELGAVGRSVEHMAERIERLLSGQQRFLGDVAHELCSPLARIRAGLGVLEHSLDENQKPRVESIDEDVSELSDLLSELLAFTRASTAPDASVIERVELKEVIEPAVHREVPGHQVEWKGVEGVAVMADRRLLGRAIANILRNAHRHGGPECKITITARGRGEKIELSIEDTGPGVPEASLPHLFEPFYRPDQSRTRESGGVGLGMAIVRSGIEASNGRVEAYAADPTGLVLLITLKGARRPVRSVE
ncbi:MAG: sensor histidine kinase [Verrucomicrobiales bacterium]